MPMIQVPGYLLRIAMHEGFVHAPQTGDQWRGNPEWPGEQHFSKNKPNCMSCLHEHVSDDRVACPVLVLLSSRLVIKKALKVRDLMHQASCASFMSC